MITLWIESVRGNRLLKLISPVSETRFEVAPGKCTKTLGLLLLDSEGRNGLGRCVAGARLCLCSGSVLRVVGLLPGKTRQGATQRGGGRARAPSGHAWCWPQSRGEAGGVGENVTRWDSQGSWGQTRLTWSFTQIPPLLVTQRMPRPLISEGFHLPHELGRKQAPARQGRTQVWGKVPLQSRL